MKDKDIKDLKKELKELKELFEKKYTKSDSLKKRLNDKEKEELIQNLKDMIDDDCNNALIMFSNRGTAMIGQGGDCINIIMGFLHNLKNMLDGPMSVVAELLRIVANDLEKDSDNDIDKTISKLKEELKEMLED